MKQAIQTTAIVCGALLLAATAVCGQQPAPLAGQEAQLWLQHSFSPEDGAVWKHVGFTPEEARRWVKAGITYAQWADQWRGEGFNPRQAMPTP